MERPGQQLIVAIVAADLAAKVKDALRDAVDLARPGRGLVFSIDLTRVEGPLP